MPRPGKVRCRRRRRPSPRLWQCSITSMSRLPHDLGSTRGRAELATSAQAGQGSLQTLPTTIAEALAVLNYIDEFDRP